MADAAPAFDPNQPFTVVNDAAPVSAGVAPPFDPSKPFQAVAAPPPQPGLIESATKPITSIPETYENMIHESVGQMGRGIGQIETGRPWEMAKGVGNVALGGLGYVGAPISAPLHTIVGKPVENIVGSVAGPTAGKIAGSAAEIGAGFALPVPRLPHGKLPEMPESPYGVTLSGGEQAGDVAMRQRENAAIRSGEAPDWVAQRAAQLDQARESLQTGLDPTGGQLIAQTPKEAGELVSQGVQQQAAIRKAAVQNAYQTARGLPGEIHASAFQGIGPQIKSDLSSGTEPVIISDKLTPYASDMINYLDDKVASLNIPNKASPTGAPNPQDIVGVNLNGIDQWRKTLSAYRKQAFSSGNPSDGRAAQAVLDAFDKQVDNAVNSGMFSGDPSAVQAWNNARAAYSDYASTYKGRDPVGRVVQKIIGDNKNDPLTPTKVVDQIVGSSGIAPSATNIAVAKRIKGILGESSPEWIAAKQGILAKLIQPGEGESAFGTGQIAQRLSKFLNGDVAGTVYSPQEMATLRDYANLMRRITMPPGSYAPSEPAIRRAVSLIGYRTGQIIGALVARHIVPGAGLVGELGGITIGGKTEKALSKAFGDVSDQLPILADKIQQWQKAQSIAQSRPNPFTQRMATGSTLALQKALSPLGVDLHSLLSQGPIPAGAQPSPQQPTQNTNWLPVTVHPQPQPNQQP